MRKRIFVSLGDLSAASYIYEIFKKGFAEYDFVGITDSRLREIGFESIADISELSVVGIVEVLPNLWTIKKIFNKAVDELKDCNVLIACDAPGFNLRLIKRAKSMGVKRIIYFISPQVWAWKPHRAKIIAEFADHIVVILPFEVDIYRRIGKLGVHYLGHPLVDMVRPSLSEDDFRKKTQLKGDFINLMPGSRWGEIKRHVPFLKEVALYLLKYFRDIEFVVPTFDNFKDYIERRLEGLPVKVISGKGMENPAYNSLFYSRASIIASGTASLEASLALNPHVVFYRISPLTYLIGRHMVKVSHLSLTNIILGRGLVPEFINKSSVEVAEGAVRVVQNKKHISESMEKLRDILGPPGVIVRLRKLFSELISVV